MTITLNSGTSRYFRWPYQAKVMKMLETVSSKMVRMERSGSPFFAECRRGRNTAIESDAAAVLGVAAWLRFGHHPTGG
jgi:hypothetical protein